MKNIGLVWICLLCVMGVQAAEDLVGNGDAGAAMRAAKTVATVRSVGVDLRTGVRTAAGRTGVLPFAWSSKYYAGEPLASADLAKLVVRLQMARMKGTSRNLAKWVEDESTRQTLVQKKGNDESTYRWQAIDGVWRASLEFLLDDEVVDKQVSVFDLRGFTYDGMTFYLR